MGFKFKVFFHPIILTPLFGVLFGREGFTTGVTLGVIVELIWGSNMVDYEEQGLKYGLLLSLLSLSLVILTNNISIFLNLALVLLLVYAFQEVVGFVEDKEYFIYLVFVFNFILLLGDGLIQELLGWIPAQFLEELSIGGGSLIPLVGLSILLIQALNPTLKRDNVWYYSYGISTVITSFILFQGQHWGIILFPLIWYLLYWTWEKVDNLAFKDYLRIGLVVLVVLSTPYIIELNIINIEGWIENILWSEALLASVSILRIFKLTGIEGYFIVTLLGVIGARWDFLL
ncbi:hypothetical protein [Halonatronum saccharophilum]|uniref:hypothetical protein n=1 Tax=Halonatronum saccharophilum TaxID=150060 RepID=UPI001FE12389|nr:hypothetical protein [Halonatronum saccharophilum]